MSEIIQTVLVRDVRTGIEWFESLQDYAANPIQGTIVVHDKPKKPEPIVCEARYFTAFSPMTFRGTAEKYTRHVIERKLRERFIRGL